MKKKSTKSTKTKKNESYNLLYYVSNSTPHMKKFETVYEMNKFIKRFQKKYPDDMSRNSGSWIDHAVHNVRGEIHFFSDGTVLE